MTLDLRSFGTGGVVSAQDAAGLAAQLRLDESGVMSALLPAAARLALPPISRYHVGAIARGTTTGNLYFGANLEFAGISLSFTVHAEQSAVANAWAHGERGIDLVATSAPPCGYCRQFLNELSTAAELRIVSGERTTPLADLLPASFGPRDLGVSAGLLEGAGHSLEAAAGGGLDSLALEAADRSHAPYSRSFAGAAVRTRAGLAASGSYAENAAFNPSLSPLQAALSNLNLAGGRFDEIEEAVLACTDDMHEAEARTVLASVSPVPLRLLRARNSA